jgi:D-alanyl-D-alanine carboxypeptidase
MERVSHASPARVAQVRARLEAAAQEVVRRGAIGVAAKITLPGQPTVRVAAGSIDAGGSAPLTGDERFAIASQSKMFTAACVLLLARDGAIGLDDPVTRYVPDVPAVDDSATIAQFLNHTSGIGNFIQAMPVLPHPWPTMSYDDIMGLAKLQGRLCRAGERFDYNNTDVVVLSRLCERVSDRPFGELLAERVLRPLGMHDTCIAAGDGWSRERMARGYYLPSQGYSGPPIDVSTLRDYSIASAAGNIVSSLDDLLRWAQCLAGEPNAAGFRHEEFAGGVADAGTDYPSWFMPRTYGRGVECWSWGGRRYWGHRGSFFGYHSGTFVEPTSGVALSLFLTMCTAGSFMRFIDGLAYEYMQFMAACAQMAADAVEFS